MINLNNFKKTPIVYDINIKKKTIKCVIQCIDSFGNGTTNIPIINNKIKNSEFLLSKDMKINVDIRGNTFEGIFTSFFSNVPIKSIIFLVGSTGFLEISLNQANASKELGFNVGDIITIKL